MCVCVSELEVCKQCLALLQMRQTPDGRYQCTLCGAVYSAKKHCKRHVVSIHVNPRRHVCPVCGRAFNYMENLKSHVRCHVDMSMREHTDQ